MAPNADYPYTDRELREAYIKDLWQQFNDLFPTDKDCIEEILRQLGISTTNCKLCGSCDVELRKESRVMDCFSCGKRIWLTADTFFGYIKKPRAWLGAIWLFERGAITNACAFQKLADIVYSSSLAIFHKVSTTIAQNMSDEFPIVESSQFFPLFERRSRETPKRRHPAADEWTALDDTQGWEDPLPDLPPNQHRKPSGSSDANSQTQNLNDVQASIFENLSETPANIEQLCVKTGISASEVISNITILELMDLVRSVSPEAFVANKRQPFHSSKSQANTSARSVFIQMDVFFEFIDSIFKRISRKYVRQYLAAYWCLHDRVRWKTDEVFKACKSYGPLPYRRLAYSHSPREVLFPTHA